MGAFATMAAAESRARVLMDGGNSATYGVVTAHVARNEAGTIGVRVQRLCDISGGYGVASKTADGANKGGAWDFLTDDAST